MHKSNPHTRLKPDTQDFLQICYQVQTKAKRPLETSLTVYTGALIMKLVHFLLADVYEADAESEAINP